MRLKNVVFYQGVKLWDGNLFQTVVEGKNKGNLDVRIDIESHMISLTCPTQEEVIVVGTSNMREARHLKTAAVGLPDTENKPVPQVDDAQDASVGVKTSGFDPSKYAGKPAEEKVVKPTKSVKK